MAADGQPRTYTAAEREEALRLYLDMGPAEAGRRLSIRPGTIRQWAFKAGLTDKRHATARAGAAAARLTWAQRRADVARRAGDAAALFVEDAIASDKARDRRDLMASFKMAAEGAQLLSPAAGRPAGERRVAWTRRGRRHVRARRAVSDGAR
ncbi:MAG: hypothetical protein H0T69_02960 [Thermoleophilaceae bacterium]|nr:hypothetical protein [Thermoleophilaceae bacterium]